MENLEDGRFDFRDGRNIAEVRLFSDRPSMGSNLTLQLNDETPAQYMSEITEGNKIENFIKDDFEKTCRAVEDHMAKQEWQNALKRIIDIEKPKNKPLDFVQQKV